MKKNIYMNIYEIEIIFHCQKNSNADIKIII